MNEVKYISTGTGSGKTHFVVNEIINGSLKNIEVVYCCQTIENCFEMSERLKEVNPLIIFGRKTFDENKKHHDNLAYTFNKNSFKRRVIITTKLRDFQYDPNIFEKITDNFKRVLVIDELPEINEVVTAVFDDNARKNVLDEHEVIDFNDHFFKIFIRGRHHQWFSDNSPRLNKVFAALRNETTNLLIEKEDYYEFVAGKKKKVNFVIEYDYSYLRDRPVIILSADIQFNNDIVKQTNASKIENFIPYNTPRKTFIMNVNNWMTTNTADKETIIKEIEKLKNREDFLICIPAALLPDISHTHPGNYCTSYAKGIDKFAFLKFFIDYAIRNLSRYDIKTTVLYYSIKFNTKDANELTDRIFKDQIILLIQNAGRIARLPEILTVNYVFQTFKQAKWVAEVLESQGHTTIIKGITDKKLADDPAYNYILKTVKEVLHQNDKGLSPELYVMVINHPIFYKFNVLTEEGNLTKLSAVAHLLGLKKSTLKNHYSNPYKKMVFEEGDELFVQPTERNKVLNSILNELNNYAMIMINTDNKKLNAYDRKTKQKLVKENVKTKKVSFYIEEEA